MRCRCGCGAGAGAVRGQCEAVRVRVRVRMRGEGCGVRVGIADCCSGPPPIRSVQALPDPDQIPTRSDQIRSDPIRDPIRSYQALQIPTRSDQIRSDPIRSYQALPDPDQTAHLAPLVLHREHHTKTAYIHRRVGVVRAQLRTIDISRILERLRRLFKLALVA
mgnify:CR=1 FL=1